MTTRSVKPTVGQLRAHARQQLLDGLRDGLPSMLARLDSYPRALQAVLLNAAIALEDEGPARPEVICDLMEKLIEVTSE